MSGAEWLTLAGFVAVVTALAQLSPQGALWLTLAVGVIIGVRALPANQQLEQHHA